MRGGCGSFLLLRLSDVNKLLGDSEESHVDIATCLCTCNNEYGAYLFGLGSPFGFAYKDFFDEVALVGTEKLDGIGSAFVVLSDLTKPMIYMLEGRPISGVIDYNKGISISVVITCND